ncbi:MAG: GNAT family N-acetyltransferase [Candidatus Bathyarchaeia archaeon]
MLHVKRMCAEDFLFAVQLANTMNWNMAIEDFEFATQLEPNGCFVLFSNDERIGIATSVSYGEVGWFGNFVIKESFRQKNAGALLLQHSIAYLKRSGATTIGLYAYPQLTGYYNRFGFKSDATYSVFQGKVTKQLSHSQPQLKKIEKQDIAAIMAFDNRYFHGCREKLLSPILKEKGNVGYITLDEQGISGYCTATVYSNAAAIGPLMSRKNTDSAVPLLQIVLGKLEKYDVFACAPTEENALIEILIKSGLQEQFRVTRMFLGPPITENCIYMPESLERG